ncbi:hypothetical protein SAMN05216203_3104 [Marinobacter daqiaonensis]|uniref:Uncharacterized protein n=1 Tax=Marinobacter daqiaonensis TaxID=650891 RepID=A0A1I6JP01_9GAMM|nr:DUF6064 family protein [Marinobacter daqiaonensis]SFR80689.1 hypothetical protein SAMN05216203_3104 [Marinobacter daqiaonensis]
METLFSYRPGDLLLFSPRVYWQLVAGNNDAFWPLPLLAPLMALVLLWALYRQAPAFIRTSLALTAVAWAFVCLSFLWLEYRTINPWVTWTIAPFLFQGGALLLTAARPPQPPAQPHRKGLSLMLVAWGGLIHPLGVLVDQRNWAAADTWLLYPEPLAVATLGLVLGLTRGWRCALLLPIPMVWCVIGGATLLGLESPFGWGVLLAPLVAITALLPLTR